MQYQDGMLTPGGVKKLTAGGADGKFEAHAEAFFSPACHFFLMLHHRPKQHYSFTLVIKHVFILQYFDLSLLSAFEKN